MQDSPTLRHIYGPFDKALSDLRGHVLMMAALTSRAMENARKGLFLRDVSACGVAIADDEEIDALEVQIDRDGMEILLKYQPVASDMRQVLSAMKMSGNIERVADQVVTIARRARKLSSHPPLPELSRIEPMFDIAVKMFSDAAQFYADSNLEGARGMKERDRELDELNRGLCDLIANRMAENISEIQNYLHLLFICRVLERIGDHATNMCEEVVFLVSARDIRHQHSKA